MLEPAHRVLKRLLVSGPLTGLPTRPADLKLLLELAALRFAADCTYSEREVNEILSTWLETFCAPFGIDHVTMRRLMVDAGMLARDKAGNAYRIESVPAPESRTERVEPAEILAEIRREREARKRKHLGAGL